MRKRVLSVEAVKVDGGLYQRQQQIKNPGKGKRKRVLSLLVRIREQYWENDGGREKPRKPAPKHMQKNTTEWLST